MVVLGLTSRFPSGMTERKTRTGARYASEKQVLRCAQNDNQKCNDNYNCNCKIMKQIPFGNDRKKSKGNCKNNSKGGMQGSLHYAS